MNDLIEDASAVVFTGAGIDQRSLVVAGHDIEKGLLVVCAAGFTQDVEVGVVFMDLPLGFFHALGATGDPVSGEDASFRTGTVRLWDLEIEAEDA